MVQQKLTDFTRGCNQIAINHLIDHGKKLEASDSVYCKPEIGISKFNKDLLSKGDTLSSDDECLNMPVEKAIDTIVDNSVL
jgi:hypothetical protein